jgi:von Willebrand factor type A domain
MGNFNKTILLLTASMTLGACAKMNFAPANLTDQGTESIDDVIVPPPGPGIECRKDQVKINRPTRVLFIVDQSGSNVNGPYEAPGVASDAKKKFRGDVMSQFYQANRSKTNLSWGLTVFNATSALNLLTDSSNKVVPFSTVPNDFNNAFTRFLSREDVGHTPYKAALSLAKQMIEGDKTSAPQHVSYLVVFMTDGYPTDYCPKSSDLTCPGKILENKIDADVKAISDIIPGDIQFSTVYYGKSDSEAAKRLNRMAKIGSGQFVDTNTTKEVKLDDILNVDKEVCVEK